MLLLHFSLCVVLVAAVVTVVAVVIIFDGPAAFIVLDVHDALLMLILVSSHNSCC